MFLGYRWGNWYLNGGQSYLSVPPPDPTIFDQYRVMLLYGNIAKRGFSAAANIGFDTRLHYLSLQPHKQTTTGLLRHHVRVPAFCAGCGAQRKCLSLRLQPHERRHFRHHQTPTATLLSWRQLIVGRWTRLVDRFKLLYFGSREALRPRETKPRNSLRPGVSVREIFITAEDP